jgi:hypothetical protein
MSNTAETIGEAIGGLIGVGLIVGAIVFGVSACSDISLPSVGSKWMTGKELAAKDADMNTPEAQAVIASFDKDNGKIYCVPKMSGAELGEFRAKIPALMIGSIFKGAFTAEGMKDFNQDKPIESVLRMTFTQSYPCK